MAKMTNIKASKLTNLIAAQVVGEGKLITTFDSVVDMAKNALQRGIAAGKLDSGKVNPVSVVVRVGEGQRMTSADKKVSATRVRVVFGAEWSPAILDEDGKVITESMPVWTVYIPSVYMGDHKAMLRQVILGVVIASVRGAKGFSDKQLAKVKAGLFSIVNVPLSTHEAPMEAAGIECTDVLEHAQKGGVVLVGMTDAGLKRYKTRLARIEDNTHTVGRAQVFTEAANTRGSTISVPFASVEEMDAFLTAIGAKVDDKTGQLVKTEGTKWFQGKVGVVMLKAEGSKLSAVS